MYCLYCDSYVKPIIIKHHILKHHIPELPMYACMGVSRNLRYRISSPDFGGTRRGGCITGGMSRANVEGGITGYVTGVCNGICNGYVTRDEPGSVTYPEVSGCIHMGVRQYARCVNVIIEYESGMRWASIGYASGYASSDHPFCQTR